MAKRRRRGHARPDRLVECRFLVPLVRDSDRRPHARKLWDELGHALLRLFGGFTGPEGPVPGAWRSRAGRTVHDSSRRYSVALSHGRVDELRELVRRVATSFDQECIFFVVGADAEFVEADPSGGLEGA